MYNKMDKILREKDSEIWEFPKFPPKDDSITKYDYLKVYEDHHGSGTLENATDYSFTTDNEDIWLLPSESYLKLNIILRKNADNTEYQWRRIPAIAADPNAQPPVAGQAEVLPDDVNLNDNGYNVFREARYFISDQEIERLNYVGIVTMLRTLLNQNNWLDYNDGTHSELMFLDSGKRQRYIRETGGNLHLLLPVKKIFPFFQQNKHVFRGVKHRLTFTLNDANQLVQHAVGVDAGTVKIRSMLWVIPYVEPSLNMMAKLETQLASQNSYKLNWNAVNIYKEQPPKLQEIRIPLASTVHKPTNVFVMCQNSNRDATQEAESMIFDNMNLGRCYVEINSVRFPDSALEADFNNNDYVEIYKRFLDACKFQSFVGNYIDFKNNYAVWHVDVSQHKPQLYENSSFPNINVYLNFKQVPIDDYIVWIIVYNDREATLNIDQRKMLVIR